MDGPCMFPNTIFGPSHVSQYFVFGRRMHANRFCQGHCASRSLACCASVLGGRFLALLLPEQQERTFWQSAQKTRAIVPSIVRLAPIVADVFLPAVVEFGRQWSMLSYVRCLVPSAPKRLAARRRHYGESIGLFGLRFGMQYNMHPRISLRRSAMCKNSDGVALVG